MDGTGKEFKMRIKAREISLIVDLLLAEPKGISKETEIQKVEYEGTRYS